MRVVAAMSGGVDSAVAAARMVDAGHEVVGVHLALSQNAATLRESARGCCTIEDAGDARRVADVLGIPFYVWDLAARFREEVVEDFLAEYAAGRTPNPCVRCNERIKFAALLDKAVALGFDAVATGHYAQVVERPDGRRELHRAVDPQKDQSYVLGVLDEDQLSRRSSRSATRPSRRSARRPRPVASTSRASPTATTSASSRTATPAGSSAGPSVSSPATSSTRRGRSSDPIPAHTGSPSGSDAGSGSTAEVWTASLASSSASRRAPTPSSSVPATSSASTRSSAATPGGAGPRPTASRRSVPSCGPTVRSTRRPPGRTATRCTSGSRSGRAGSRPGSRWSSTRVPG